MASPRRRRGRSRTPRRTTSSVKRGPSVSRSKVRQASSSSPRASSRSGKSSSPPKKAKKSKSTRAKKSKSNRSKPKTLTPVVKEPKVSTNVSSSSDDLSHQSGAYVSFVLIYVSYVFFYFCRKNYPFWLKELIQTVGIDQQQASIFGSVMELSYGTGKLVTGPFVDMYSPSKILAGTLAVASICNLLLFRTSYLSLDIFLWGVNGFAQAAAWPALALIFLNWFKNSPMRGTWYAVLSTNQNLGSMLCPVLLTGLIRNYGWTVSTVFPGTVSLVYAAVLLLYLSDGPAAATSKAEKNKKEKTKPKPSWKEISYQLACDVNLWYLGLGYAFLTVIRVALSDWSLIILDEVHHMTNEDSRNCLISMELGGLIGGVASGTISDKFFHGKRGATMVLFTLLASPTAYATIFMPVSRFPVYGPSIMVAIYFLLGMFSFGPHMMVGLFARELTPDAPSTAGSFCKSIGQVGGAIAGYPLSFLAANYGWEFVGLGWAVCGVLGTLCFLPMANVASKMKSS